MNINKYLIIFKLLLFSGCLCEISEGEKEKLLNGFLEHYNSLPDQIYQSNEGSLQSTQQVDDTTYEIVVKLTAKEIQNAEVTKSLTCTATLKDSDDHVRVTHSHCQYPGQEDSSQEKASEGQAEVTEPVLERRPVQLDNEVQSDTAISSGEQFIAIPRDQPSVPCFGCATHVNPQAAGVSELASLGLRHLDIHQPSTKHTLDRVLDVERQVQVVNGVRYILTMSVNFNNCSDTQPENCMSSNICKITFLVKPWVKLSNGANYRAILGNNCTEEWLYGDNGEVLPESVDNQAHDKDEGNKGNDGGDIQVKHHTDVQSQPNMEKSLTDEEIKNLEEQIIPNNQFQENYQPSSTMSPDSPEVNKEHVFKAESSKRNENSIPVTEQNLNINSDKKKAIDDLLNFFDFSGFKLKTESTDTVPRIRRSYDYDLQLLTLAEDYHGIKNSIENARFIYGLAQTMVNYLNEMDLEVKNRVVKSVIKAEEEADSLQRYIYVQASVTIPCDKVECEPKDSSTQICNGVIDATNDDSPQIISSFCYDDNKERDYRDSVKEIPLDDPVLQNFVLEAVKKIESESKSENALKVNKIISAITQVTSGTLTKFSIIVDNLKCNKSVPLALRTNCKVLEQLGSQICEIIVHERHWMKETKISYSCTDRPVDMKISKKVKSITQSVNVEDPKIIEMLQEAIQFLETKSEKNNKQKIVNVTSITSQIIAGFLTKIEFVVGYTNCTDGNELVDESNKCQLLKGQNLRLCKAQFWDRSWIIDGRQVEVSCDDVKRKKRSVDFVESQGNDEGSPEIKYKKLANESLQKFMQSSPSHQHYEVVKVDKVDVQNVPDKLIRIKFSISPTNCELKNGILSPNECHVINPENVIYCHSKILENVWVDKKQFFVNCNLKDYRRYEKSSGLQERDPNDSKYVKKSDSLKQNIKDSNAMQIAVEALQTFLKNNPESLLLRVTLVDKVVIEGPTTKIAFLASHTEDDDGDTICYAEFFASKGVTEVKCHSIGLTIRQTEVTDEDPNYYKYIQLADESLYIYLQKINSSQLYTVASIESVMVQWDEGIKTQINFIISPTDLENHENQAKQCRAEIREQPWIYKKNIDVKCELDRNLYRSKRQVYDKKNVIGGLTNKDPNDPKYRVLAEESLRKFITDSGTTEDLQLVRVEKVTTQVVSGSLTRIDFVISGGQVINKCHSKIWEQPWMNKKDIEVSCHNGDQRSKREAILGGLTEQNPNDPKYRALAEASLRKFILNSRTTEHLQLVRVEKVTTQVVSGTLIRIDFVISGGRDISKCHSEIWEQPWMNKKQIDVSCHNGDQSSKREAMTGGLTDRNPIDPQYRMMAEESLLKFIVESGTTRPLRVVRVEKVTTQVVAGSLTRIEFEISVGQDIYKCHSKIWVQPWLNKKYIEVSCHNGDQSRKKEAIPGGLTDRNPNDPKYRALAEESLQKFITDSGTTEPLQIVRIEKITTQEVIGPLNHIDFVISDGQDINKCHSEIWEQPWMNKNYIEVSCHNSDQKNKSEAIPGGLTDQNPNDPKYRALAEESLRKFIVESGTTQPLRVVRVEKVTTQVVAGSLTRIDFVISGGQDINKCHSKIWEQPWINKKDIEVSCHNGDQRSKREAIPGGLTDQNPNDPKYRALAEESLLKFIADSGTTEPLKMVRVEKVTTQVVAGMMTRIDFTVSDGKSKTMKCHSEILEQVWVGRKEVNVDCLPINIRARRDLVMPRGLVEQNLIKPKFNVPLGKKPSPGSGTEMSLHNVRGNDEEEQNPNKPEYKLLAEESLRKFQQKSTVYHKVLEVKRVLTRVVSGLKYNIDFTAAPTACSVNESRVNARRCKTDDEIILYCHTEIWDRPWLRKKNIDVQCNDPSDDRDDFVEDDSDIAEVNSEKESNNSENHMKLANAATEKYLTASNRKYVHKVTGIQSISEPQLDGTFTIDFTISPTTCLRNVSNKDSCKVKQPVVVFHCNAKIRNLPSGNNENEIEVTCRKASEGVNKSKKDKRDVGIGNARQTVDDAEEMDEDVIYYYADRALQHVNDNSRSNNLHKLISIHAVQSSVQMGERTVKMYIEIAETYCLRHHRTKDLKNCEELNGLNHRLCLARLWPAPDEELITRHISVVCDDEEDFVAITGVNVPELLRLSLIELERAPGAKYKLVHQGEPQVIPSLDSRQPFKINFIVAYTNCSIDVDLDKNPFQCYLNTEIPSKTCHSFIWLKTDIRHISYINVKCANLNRWRRSTNQTNTTSENGEINSMVAAALEKLEMSSLHRYKQRVLQINSHSTKITSGKVTTIDFDVGYTSCLKYEWVENITSCDFLEHLPRRRCVAQIWERLWIKNGQNIDVNCVDDETPLESHIEFESAEMANALAKEALKHIEAKYPHPSKQKVVRIFSLEKQVVAGIHYKMKVEVGFTDCLALSDQTDCKLLKDHGLNKFCRVNVWVRPWTDHPPNFRVSCDFQEGATHDLYHHVQAEQLFYNFLTTYSPSYVNDYSQMQKRFEIFKNNIKKIHELNVHEKGTAVYGVTRFTDLTYEEFSSTYMGLNTNLTNENQVPMTKADIPDIKLPEDFDWREHDAVTEVKDQGQCGSCWAFSVTGNIEGQWKMQSGQLVSLSEQELVDCDKLDDGCNGGLPDNAYRAIEQMGGLELESDYPYEGVGEKCEFNKTLAKVQISGAVNITTNETGMAQWLVHNGPISIGINANAMQFYMGGISHPWKMLCNPTNLDHGVLIVGYGIKDYPLFHKKLPYWIIKNSWGKSWGEQGYYRVYRGDGTCGVNQMASSAII